MTDCTQRADGEKRSSRPTKCLASGANISRYFVEYTFLWLIAGLYRRKVLRGCVGSSLAVRPCVPRLIFPKRFARPLPTPFPPPSMPAYFDRSCGRKGRFAADEDVRKGERSARMSRPLRRGRSVGRSPRLRQFSYGCEQTGRILLAVRVYDDRAVTGVGDFKTRREEQVWRVSVCPSLHPSVSQMVRACTAGPCSVTRDG